MKLENLVGRLSPVQKMHAGLGGRTELCIAAGKALCQLITSRSLCARSLASLTGVEPAEPARLPAAEVHELCYQILVRMLPSLVGGETG